MKIILEILKLTTVNILKYNLISVFKNLNKSAKWHCGRHTTIKKT